MIEKIKNIFNSIKEFFNKLLDVATLKAENKLLQQQLEDEKKKHQPLIDKQAFIQQLEHEKKTFKPKGEMIKVLKAKGIRTGEKDGAIVKLEHLKTFAVTKLYYDNL